MQEVPGRRGGVLTAAAICSGPVLRAVTAPCGRYQCSQLLCRKMISYIMRHQALGQRGTLRSTCWRWSGGPNGHRTVQQRHWLSNGVVLSANSSKVANLHINWLSWLKCSMSSWRRPLIPAMPDYTDATRAAGSPSKHPLPPSQVRQRHTRQLHRSLTTAAARRKAHRETEPLLSPERPVLPAESPFL